MVQQHMWLYFFMHYLSVPVDRTLNCSRVPISWTPNATLPLPYIVDNKCNAPPHCITLSPYCITPRKNATPAMQNATLPSENASPPS